MHFQAKYQINPDIIWVNESNGKILLIMPENKKSICLKGLDAAMWRSIWQGISPFIWEGHIKVQGKKTVEILQEWITAGLITVVHS